MLNIVASVRNAVMRRGFSLSVRTNVNYKLAPLQEAALEEKCILVDEYDNILGQESKRNCHKVGENQDIPLHRAFSVFLFNQTGDLLLQKRSESKITFPGHYTNTCCSHPLMEIPGEVEEAEALGIKRAALRRLNYELGIPTNEIKLNDFYYVTRIHYKDLGDNVWGEHEIDYILFLQKNKINLNLNPDEVSEIQWISKSMMNDFVKKCQSPLTPWFKLILKHKLPLWWNHLDDLDQIKDHNIIQRF